MADAVVCRFDVCALARGWFPAGALYVPTALCGGGWGLARGLFLAGDLSIPVALYRGGGGRAPCLACSSGMGWCRAHAVRASIWCFAIFCNVRSTACLPKDALDH